METIRDDYTCACGQVVCRVVPDWQEGTVLLCGPHWKFWQDERIQIEYPPAAIELAESREADPGPEPGQAERDMGYFWASRGPWEG